MRKLVLLVFAGLLASGCGGGSSTVTSTTTTEAPPTTTEAPPTTTEAPPTTAKAPPTTTEAPPTTTKALSPQLGGYETVSDIRAGLALGGFECDSFELMERAVNALERAHCTESTTLAIQNSRWEAFFALEEMQRAVRELGFGIEDYGAQRAVIGPNWSVICSETECPTIRQILGGDIVAVLCELFDGTLDCTTETS